MGVMDIDVILPPNKALGLVPALVFVIAKL